MGNRSLIEYISKYREIILKLNDLNEFQKKRGFVRGLQDYYRLHVKSHYLKTLDEAIKHAQTFDDDLEKDKKNSNCPSSSN